MAWRGLHVTQPARLRLGQGQIIIAQDEGEVRLALEDLAYLVIDQPQVTLTAALLSACMDAGIPVIVTDGTHLPSGLALPFHRHHRQADVARAQAAMALPLKKRLWQRVVRGKIANQAGMLDGLGREGGAALRAMAARVRSGDPDNVEARAARHYWGALWPRFRRDDAGDRRNKLLNYGYAVARAGIARALVAAGLLPAFGIGHASATNAFNLADDLVEPLRPFVDRLAWQVSGEGLPSREDLTLEDRRAMVGVLTADAAMAGETVSLLTACERMANGLVAAIETRTPAPLVLPAPLPP